MVNPSDQAAQIDRAIRTAAIALGLFALLVAFTALVVISQAVLRQLRVAGLDLATLRALGLSSGQLWAISLVQVAAMAAGGFMAVILSRCSVARECNKAPAL